MIIEWPHLVPGQEKWFSSSLRIARGRDPLLLPDALPDLLASPRAMIVESDRIRFIPAEDAKKFWSDWWTGEQERK
jgi:hypothetical protein